MAGKVQDIAKLFGQQVLDQAKAQSQKQLADAQVIASMINLKGGMEQFKADLATRHAEAQAAGQTGAEADPGPTIPENPLPDPRNPLNGLPSILQLPEMVAGAGPAGVQGGAAVQAGLKGQGAQPQSNVVPPTITSTREQTQYARNEPSPFLTEFVPLTTRSRTTTDNVMTPAQAARLQIEQQRADALDRQQRASVTLNLIREGYGADSARIADSLYTGLGLAQAIGGKKGLTERQIEASIAAENTRSSLYRQQIVESQVKTLADLQALQQSVTATPFSIATGLRSPRAAGAKGALTDSQLLQEWQDLHDKDGNIKKGLETNFAQLQLEWADRGYLALHERAGIFGGGKTTPAPMADLVNQATAAALKDGDAYSALLKSGLFVETKEGALAPSPKLEANTQRIVNGILNLGETRAAVAGKTGQPLPEIQAPPEPKTEETPAPAANPYGEKLRGDAQQLKDFNKQFFLGLDKALGIHIER